MIEAGSKEVCAERRTLNFAMSWRWRNEARRGVLMKSIDWGAPPPPI